MNLVGALRRRKSERNAEVVQATLDPHGPGVARLHLVPPKPSLRGGAPSLLIINGWHILPIGPSWAALLRAFLMELNERCVPGQEIGEEEMDAIVDAVVREVIGLYPDAEPSKVEEDLDTIIAIILAIVQGQPLPAGIETAMTLRDYAKHMTAPHRMDLIVSPMVCNGEWRCQLHCTSCYAMGQPAMTVERELTTEEWKRVIDFCRAVGVPQITFTGGEPTMRDDLVELVSYAQWHVTRLNTNGVALTAELSEQLVKAGLDGVQITLYSHDPTVHDRLVGQDGAWCLTVAGIYNSIAAGLSVSINTPLLSANADYAETLRFIHSLGVRYVSCSGLIPTGAATVRMNHGEALTNGALMTVMEEAVSVCRELEVELSFTSPGWLTEAQLKSLGLTYPACGACLSNMAVGPDGRVFPCQSWLHDQGLGNILTEPWSKIWNHELCRRLRGETPSGCPLKEVVK